MTQDEIIEMAREAGFEDFVRWSERYPHEVQRWIERMTAFAKLVEEKATEKANARANASWTLMCEKMVAFEREECAKVADEYMRDCEGRSFGVGTAIRARGDA
jgi:hypothetical protein